MTRADFLNLAVALNEAFRPLQKKRLYSVASYMPANENWPERIVIESLKYLRSTGRFTDNDRELIKKTLRTTLIECNAPLLVKRTEVNSPFLHNYILSETQA